MMRLAGPSVSASRAIALVVGVLVLSVGMSATAVVANEDTVEAFFRGLARASEIALLTLASPDGAVAFLAATPSDSPERDLFLESPRDYLAEFGIVFPDELAMVTALDTSRLADETLQDGTGWFGVSEGAPPRTAGQPEGVGLFYGNIGLVVQITTEEDDVFGGFVPTEATEAYVDTVQLIGLDVLDRLAEFLAWLNELPLESSQRTLFLANPRQLMGDNGIDLPADFFRLTSFDFERAEALEEVHGIRVMGVSPAAAGFAVVRVAIVVSVDDVFVVVQEAR